MFASKALGCECGYEVRATDEAACVASVRRHAWEAHGIDFSVEFAREVVRRAARVPSSERIDDRGRAEEQR